MKKIESRQEFEQFIDKEAHVVVDFYADWCGPCQVLSPTLEDLSRDFKGRVAVVKVDVDAQPELAQQFRVMSIPTLVFFRDKKVVQTLLGLRSKEDLRKQMAALDIQAN